MNKLLISAFTVAVVIKLHSSTGRVRELEMLWPKSVTWNVILENNIEWKDIV